jgi:hypothetical protein
MEKHCVNDKFFIEINTVIKWKMSLKERLNLSELEAKKPIALDASGNYLSIKDLEAKKPYVALTTLAPEQQQELVLKRYEMEEDFEISILAGDRLNKADVMKQIEDRTVFGIEAMRAELSYLSDVYAEVSIEEIKEELPETVDLSPWPPVEYRVIPKKYWPWFFRRYAVFAEDTDTAITKSAANYRSRYVIPCFKNKNIYPIVLTGTNDTRPNFAKACKQSGVVYISGVGHGSPTAYTGYNYDHLWDACNYDPAEVKGKIIHLLSCKTAQELGPDLIKKGACAYFGYYENFTITWNHPDVFWKCDSSIDLALCNGLDAGTAAKVAIQVYNSWITQMRAIHVPTAVWLTWDRDALRSPLHGRQYGSSTCTLRRVPFFEEIEAELVEVALKEIEVTDEVTFSIKDLFAEFTK